MRHKFPALYGIPLRPWIQEAAGDLPVRFLHDSTAFLLGEYWKGGLQGEGNAAGVMLGTGLGFAYMRNGEVQLNPQGGPGFSLYTVPYRKGAAEDYVSRRGIISRYLERTPMAGSGIDVADISRLAREGSEPARVTMRETGRMLGEILFPVLKEKGCAGLQSEGRYLKRTRCLAGTWSKPWRIFSLMVFHRPQTLTTLICLAALMCLRTGAEKRVRRPPGLDCPAGSAEIHPHEKNKIRRVFSAERPPAKIILAGAVGCQNF